MLYGNFSRNVYNLKEHLTRCTKNRVIWNQ